MIGHYLLTLPPEQEERVLTRTFEPVNRSVRSALRLGPERDGCGCLVMTARDEEDPDWEEYEEWKLYISDRGHPGLLYEHLCARFGVARVNAAIRNRILANQARRMLQHQGSRKQEAASPTL